LTGRTQKRQTIEGPAGRIELSVSDPGDDRRGCAVIAHPHPLYGGTLDNKVVQTLSKAFVALGYAAVRFNFRGVGDSEGVFDDGRGETEDLLAVVRHAQQQYGDGPLVLAGFSFGGFVAAAAAKTLHPARLVLIAPAVGRFPVDTVQEGTLVVHGEQDDVVALADVYEWARPQQLPVVVFPGTGHFFHGMLVPLQQLIMKYCRD
jgi:uncharacterized protein